ncbi:myosin C, putative [Plasmodium berghei]|uniref:Myosin F, putative n=2 Tax=Plasmodium berghei TaxID=5821 RepID=A0A509AP76_PLABA|nr:myosin F, putative [Plasmodium berghei ANKA]SCL97924.1 myosin C, putative [Plasmodium berghei]SCM16714.1 myosin C, putative [Plasmodium berghei]SCN27945.1 myosin C, putative [Plasmodium berghei]VUC57828.1 myosin F, putative [Plasmodium berghei ANKA]|eukprot:XP_034423598.1 myosin F, putative [Plasmodium berghei ANKA]
MEPTSKCVVGTKIFIKHKEKVWISAEIIKEDTDIVVKTDDDEIVNLKEGDEFFLRNTDIFNSNGLSAPPDLTKLTHLHEASVLHSLNIRFDIDEIYTFTGPILIAINPFKNIKNLYSDNILEKHIQPIKSKSPHIFATSNSAYLGMCKNNKSQTILISGESGAGKTESTKYVMKFLACAGSDIKKRSLIESQILESNPLLEAFGNSKTLRNNNSSRFGKYIELHFDICNNGYIKGKLYGAKILTYLLEKVRVCDQQEGERNYHIFYQLCSAVQYYKNKKLNLGNGDNYDDEYYYFPSCDKFKQKENVKQIKIDLKRFKDHINFRYLTKSSVYELNDVNELEEFEATVYAMQIVGIEENEQNQIFKILEGILYIGNILFNNDDNKEESCILESTYEDLNNAAYLLDIDVDTLKDALCYKTIIANNEHFKKPVTSAMASDIRDALARAIYGCLFLKLVERTNESIGLIKDVNLFCGVLDIFGFESFPVNSFEQLCINYTNECLQYFFNNFIFKCEEKLYIEEGIKWSSLDFPDNKDCVNILQSKPFGIFCMLDEESFIPGGKDKTFCNKIISKHANNKRFESIKTDPNSFIIVHFAGKVMYNSCGFLEKNKDQLSDDAQNVLLQSQNEYIHNLFKKYLRRNFEKKRFVTVSSEFKQQLDVLMTRINQTEPHFIRCIKPNSKNVPDIFDRHSVNEQLKYGGVLQAIKVSRAGYPVRLTHQNCINEYYILLTKEEKTAFSKHYGDKSLSEKANYILSKLENRDKIQDYIKSLKHIRQTQNQENIFYGSVLKKQYSKNPNLIEKKNITQYENNLSNNVIDNDKFIWYVGKTLSFFKIEAYNILLTMRQDFRSLNAVIIQKNYKCYIEKKKYKLLKKKIVTIQRWIRNILIILKKKKIIMINAQKLICSYIYAYALRKIFLYKRKCAIIIQSAFRGYLIRQSYKVYRKNYYASKIQAIWKSKKERIRYLKLIESTKKIQLKWKGILARRQLRRLKDEAKEVGALLSKNQVLMNELKNEKSEKIEIENKLLKASANAQKLTKRIEVLEQINKNNEVLIKNLIEKVENLSLKQKEENTEKNISNEHKKYISDNNEISRKQDSMSDQNLSKLLDKIKKLEIQNEEYIKKNTLLNERYNKMLNIFSYFKGKHNLINEANEKNIPNNVKKDQLNMINSILYNEMYEQNFIKNQSHINQTPSVVKDKKEIFDNNLTEFKEHQNLTKVGNKTRDNVIDILICGPKGVGKTSLVEDLFVRLGDENNLNILRKKNKKKEIDGINHPNYNTYIVNHKLSQIKIVDCGYSDNTNSEEILFEYIKNSICIIIVFDSTNKESIIPALHLLQEASLINVKKSTKLYLLENIFNEKINLNPNVNDVSYAQKVSKTCNATYIRALDIYDILNDHVNRMTTSSTYFLNNFISEESISKDMFISSKHFNTYDNNIIEYSETANSRWFQNENNYKQYIKNGNNLIFDKTDGYFQHFNKSDKFQEDKINLLHHQSSTHSVRNMQNTKDMENKNLIYLKNESDIYRESYDKFSTKNVGKKKQVIQLLRESLPHNNYVYNSKKYNPELGKGLQPVYEIMIKGNIPITYLCIGQNSINKNYTILAVGCKDGIIYIYKCFRTKMEQSDSFQTRGQGNGIVNNSSHEEEVIRNRKRGNLSNEEINNSELSTPEEEQDENNTIEYINETIKDESSFALSEDNSMSTVLLSKLSGHRKAITCLVFSFSEDKIISSSIDRTIKIWEVSTGFLLKVFSDSSATLSVLLFPTNLDIFLCSNCTSLLRIVNLNSGQVYQKIKVESEIRALEMDYTCLNIFAGSKNGTIYLLECLYNERVEIKFRFLFSLLPITCIKFVPRKYIHTPPTIIVNSCDNHIGIIECMYGNKGIITNLSVKHRIRINHALLPIRSCYTKFGGGWLVSGSEDGNIYVCSLLPQSNYKLILLKHHKAPVMSVVVNDIDTLMISGDSKGNIVFWRRSLI